MKFGHVTGNKREQHGRPMYTSRTAKEDAAWAAFNARRTQMSATELQALVARTVQPSLGK